MAKSNSAVAVDRVQAAIQPLLKSLGFRVRGRTFNRTTQDGLTQVVNMQLGASDPPGTSYIPGLRENLHGLFTVNLGVYVPEVARLRPGRASSSWIQEYDCCVRSRLGEACGESRDLWWPARFDDGVVTDLRERLHVGGLPFLERFGTRDRILAEWHEQSANAGGGSPPRIVTAIILAERGVIKRARELLSRQARETAHAGHAAYVRNLAERLGIGALDG